MESDMTIGYGLLAGLGGLYVGWMIWMLARIVEVVIDDWWGE